MSADPHLRPLIRDETFRPWAPGVHVATGTAHFLGVPASNTMCAIELAAGGLLVWNPIALTPRLADSLAELERATGRRVTTLLAALDWHHRALPGWQAAFPDARTFLVSERIRDKQPAVQGEVLSGERPVVPGCEADVELLALRGFVQPVIELSSKWRGGPRQEWFVWHRPSRSLLVGDALFCNHEATLLERWAMGFRAGISRNAGGFRVGDAEAFRASAQDVLAWPVEQALTAHGRASAHGAEFIRDELRAALV